MERESLLTDSLSGEQELHTFSTASPEVMRVTTLGLSARSQSPGKLTFHLLFKGQAGSSVAQFALALGCPLSPSTSACLEPGL